MQFPRHSKTSRFCRRARLLALLLLALTTTYFAIREISGGSRADDGLWRWPSLDFGKRSFAVHLPPVGFPDVTQSLAPDEKLRISMGAIALAERITENSPAQNGPGDEVTQNEPSLYPSLRRQIATVDIQSLLAAYTPTDAPESMRKEIRNSILQSVKRFAESGGYPLILDCSGKSLNGVDVVQFTGGGVADLTEEIREELRRYTRNR
jgi:hypothetical protein